MAMHLRWVLAAVEWTVLPYSRYATPDWFVGCVAAPLAMEGTTMSDLYRMNPDAFYPMTEELLMGYVERGALVPVTDERLSRAEWEATINRQTIANIIDDFVDRLDHDEAPDSQAFARLVNATADRVIATVKGET